MRRRRRRRRSEGRVSGCGDDDSGR